MNKSKFAGIIVGLALVLAGCGGFVYTTVGGTVTGLGATDSIVLRNESNYIQTLTADGTFNFNVASNASYAITIQTQPNTVNCTVVNGTGKMTSDAAVRNISVTCVPNVPVGGTVTGMNDNSTLVLLNNAVSSATVTGNGTFQFPVYVVNGNPYSVTVSVPPASQYCSVANGTGTANISNIAASNNVLITCVPAVPVKFTVNGLTAGTVLTMANTANGVVDKYSVTAIGVYAFNFNLLDGVPYAVTVDTQPAGQTCTVAGGTGVAHINDPTAASNIAVTCVKS
ncbi:hypothetical protein [Undibacterium sp. TJN19]|uniref:hypothetical protein n=1 Tax=Undibacterium sp. TJN19 TaxID=3413055 RepID=UPI003BF37B94